MQKLKYLAEYIPFYLLVRVLQSLPFDRAVGAGKKIGHLLYLLMGSRTKMAAENISRSLNIEAAPAQEIAKNAFCNIGATFTEFINLPSRDDDFFDNNIELVDEENFLKAKEQGKGVLLLTAHLGNWEILGALHQRRFGQIHVVYRKTKNPYVDSFIDNSRKACGFKTIPHRNAVRKIMSALKKGDTVGLLLDQHAMQQDAIVVDFFGRPAATNYGLALIALKTGAPVIPIFLVRTEEGRYRCHFDKPVELTTTGDMDENIRSATIKFNTVIEKYIRKYPDQWFWIHKRWKV